MVWYGLLNKSAAIGVSLPTDGQSDDHCLLERFFQGDQGAFAELVRRHQKPLYGFVRRQLSDHDETADVCQRVFVQVFLKARDFRGDANFKTWLYQIAINLCKNHYRSRARERLEEVDIGDLDLVAETAADDDAVANETRRMLQAAIEDLPRKQRLTLQLRFYQECSFEEIATIMRCPLGTAKANYHHAITALRRRL
jgi:RNA polymerase sigma-70 factor (ECF subfamily)